MGGSGLGAAVLVLILLEAKRLLFGGGGGGQGPEEPGYEDYYYYDVPEVELVLASSSRDEIVIVWGCLLVAVPLLCLCYCCNRAAPEQTEAQLKGKVRKAE